MMVGAYLAFFMMTFLKLPLAVAIVFSMLFCAVLGISIEKVAYKPLRNSPRIWALITAIGVSFFLETLFVILFGANYKPFPQIILPPISVGELQISRLMLISLVLCLGLVLLLELFIKNCRVLFSVVVSVSLFICSILFRSVTQCLGCIRGSLFRQSVFR